MGTVSIFRQLKNFIQSILETPQRFPRWIRGTCEECPHQPQWSYHTELVQLQVGEMLWIVIYIYIYICVCIYIFMHMNIYLRLFLIFSNRLGTTCVNTNESDGEDDRALNEIFEILET
jgi:hypothetical protein